MVRGGVRRPALAGAHQSCRAGHAWVPRQFCPESPITMTKGHVMSHSRRRLKPRLLVLLMASLIGSGCGESTGIETTASVRIAVDASFSTVSFAGLTVEVTGPGIANPIYGNLTDGGAGVWSGSLEVPVGSDRLFVISGYEAGGLVTHRGQTTADVTETNGTLEVLLSQLTGDVPLSGTIGSYTVTVSPDSAFVELGATVRFRAAITDQDGGTIADAVVWAVKNPAVVTLTVVGDSVDATGRLAGASTELVATYKGYVATATVKVN